ncbi:MAG: hypothetical protein GX546_03635 [Acholeplasmataceae bacterium]|jgi:hypothetical protein|nr:hypothetical protein [Acholeplasmataceae bacterium]
MKKVIIIFMFFLIFYNIKCVVNAGLIESYQEITFENPNHKFLRDYKVEELNEYYPKVSKRLFIGWRTYELTRSARVNFTKTTLTSIRNTGTTPIVLDQQVKTEVTQKYAVSGSGGVETSGSGTIKGFKLGLSKKLNIKADATITISQTESMSTKIQVDPMTQLDIYVKGNGRLTNGVASRYFFWIRTNTGGYEYLNITSIFYRMEKKRI